MGAVRRKSYAMGSLSVKEPSAGVRWCLSKEEEFERWSEHVEEVFDAKIIDDAVEQYEAYRREVRDWKTWAGSVLPPAQLIMLNPYIAIYVDGSAMRGLAGWAFLVYLVVGQEFTLLHAEWGPTTPQRERLGTELTHGGQTGYRLPGLRLSATTARWRRTYLAGGTWRARAGSLLGECGARTHVITGMLAASRRCTSGDTRGR